MTVAGALPVLAGLLLGGCGGGVPTGAFGREPKASAPTASRNAVPVSARTGWFEDVHARIAAGEYRVRQRGQDVSAPNRAQRLSATWIADAVSISSLRVSGRRPEPVGVRSVALGRGGAVRSLTGGRFRIGQCRSDGATDEKGECLRRVERDVGGIVEWWENRSGGLEQGFVIPQPPRAGTVPGPDWLRIEVQVLGGRAEMAPGSSRATFIGRDGRRFRYAGLVARDAANRELPTRMRPGARGVWLEVDDAEARYPILIDPILTADVDWTIESDQADAGPEMFVSGAGDVNDDGLDDVLVAFPSYNGAGADEGRVFLYLGGAPAPSDVPAWSSQGTNAAGAPAATAGSRYGASVAAAGDVDGDGVADIIIGQNLWTNGQTSEGRAYVFHGSPAGLPAVPDWVVEGELADISMGAVSGAGDIDGNGFDDVIVGAPATTGVGRISVYLGSANGLFTIPSDTILGTAGHRFGSAVASAGDVNGDGRDDVVVAASATANPEVNEGAAFAYLGRADGTLTRAGAFLSGTEDSFETNETGAQVSSVAGVGDVNGDGYADVAVGSPNKNSGGAATDVDEGVVYLFRGSAAGLTAPVIIESNQAGANLGAAVAGPGDVNGDGLADIAVGAPGWDAGAIANAGAVFLIPGSTAGPATIDASLTETVLLGAQADGNLGSTLGAAGDVNDDGFADVVAGAAGVDDGQNNEGRASLYLGSTNTNGLRRASDLAIESNTAGAGLGLAVSGAGDVNGDGFADLALAAPDFAGASSGRVFLYHGGPAGPDTTVDGTLVGPAGAGFGRALSRAGDVNGDGFGDLVVGAPNFGDGQDDEGRLFLFPGSAGGITAATVPVTFDSNVAGALLGSSVGASDVTGDGLFDVLAGAPGLANGQPAEGGLYLLRGSVAGLTTGNPVIVESNIENATFGASVAGAGDVNGDGFGDVVVGAPGYSGVEAGQGRIYVYLGQAGGLGAPITRDGDEEDAALGTSVDSAGDSDFDGFSDVAAGAPGVNDDAGAVYVYEGDAITGIVDVPYSYVSNFANGRLGASIAGAVDLDQDARADVVAGAPGFSNGEANEGAVIVFLSGQTVLPGMISQLIEGGVANLRFGSSLAGVGDVNGDGAGDVIIGAPGYTGGEPGEGRALLHLGNTNGRPYRLRALRPGSTTVVQTGNVVPASLSAFDISLLASGPLGITNVKLETEVKPRGIEFDDDDTVIDADFTSTGVAGVTLTRRVIGLAGSTAYHFRARLEFDPDQRNLRGRRTPWIYGSQAESAGVHLRTDGVAGGTACTMSAQCGAGSCVDGVCCTTPCGGGVTTDCVACTVAAGGTMPDGICSPLAVGTGCNDASSCTATDTCQAGGVCQGVTAVTCPAPDQCHDMGVCAPGTGVCSNPVKANGTTCTDSNMCTTIDSCQAGACVAGPARDCNDNNPCTTDSCQVATGCVNVAMAGCTPPPGLDGGPSDGPSGGTDGGTVDTGAGATDAPATADTRGDAAGGVVDAARDGLAGARDAAVDRTVEIKRVGGGGGCDCNVGGRGPSQAIHASVLIGLAMVLLRRRRRNGA